MKDKRERSGSTISDWSYISIDSELDELDDLITNSNIKNNNIYDDDYDFVMDSDDINFKTNNNNNKKLKRKNHSNEDMIINNNNDDIKKKVKTDTSLLPKKSNLNTNDDNYNNNINNNNSNNNIIYNNTSDKKSGKWTIQEENQAAILIRMFLSGNLDDCTNGQTLRSYLARKLNCAPMRISKKFAGKCIGKISYSHNKNKYDTNEMMIKKDNSQYSSPQIRRTISDTIPTSRESPKVVSWTVKNNFFQKDKSSDKISDAYTSNEDQSLNSSDDDKSSIIPRTIVGYFYPFEDCEDSRQKIVTVNPPFSFIPSFIPKIPSLTRITSKPNLDSISTSTSKESQLHHQLVSSIQIPNKTTPRSPSTTTLITEREWLESLNMFCSNSVENLVSFFLPSAEKNISQKKS